MRPRVRFTAGTALASAVLTLAACASPLPATTTPALPTNPPLGPFPSDAVEGLRTEPDVVYTEVTECGGTPCEVPGDVLAPADGSDLPTIVMLGGGGTPFANRRYQQPLAVALAQRGAVVFLMSYRSAVTGNYDSDSLNDARCAVRYARASTAAFGGDPTRVMVVGHSMGGFLGLEVALGPDEEAEACLADGSARPDGAVGLGAPNPSVRESNDAAVPVWIFNGAEDGNADGVAERLRELGFDAESRELPGVTHEAVTDPVATPEIVDLIWESLSSI